MCDNFTSENQHYKSNNNNDLNIENVAMQYKLGTVNSLLTVSPNKPYEKSGKTTPLEDCRINMNDSDIIKKQTVGLVINQIHLIT